MEKRLVTIIFKAVDPLDNKWLGTMNISYKPKKAGTGEYMKSYNNLKMCAEGIGRLCGIGMRRPKIITTLIYE